MFLQRTLKAGATGSITTPRRRGMPSSLFGRVSQVVRSVYVSLKNALIPLISLFS